MSKLLRINPVTWSIVIDRLDLRVIHFLRRQKNWITISRIIGISSRGGYWEKVWFTENIGDIFYLSWVIIMESHRRSTVQLKYRDVYVEYSWIFDYYNNNVQKYGFIFFESAQRTTRNSDTVAKKIGIQEYSRIIRSYDSVHEIFNDRGTIPDKTNNR